MKKSTFTIFTLSAGITATGFLFFRADAQHTDTLNPVADVYVKTYGGGEGKNTFIKFDISSIPANSVVSDVTLQVYITEKALSWDGDMKFMNVNNQTWTEGDSETTLWGYMRTDTVFQLLNFGNSPGWTSSVNLKQIFLTDYNASNNFCTVMLKDIDDITCCPGGGNPAYDSNDSLMSGNIFNDYIVFAPREFILPDSVPRLIVSYVIAPQITIQPLSQTICDGDSVFFTVATTGDAPLTFQWQKDGTDIPGADSTFFAINPVSMDTAGDYRCIVTNAVGADTSNAAVLIINPVFLVNQSTAICSGDSILLGGAYQTSSGTYYDSLTTMNGCDSIIATDLTVHPNYLINQTTGICAGDSILLGGAYQTSAGTYYDSLSTINGCDSIIETLLTVNPQYFVNQSVAICSGDSILIGGGYQTTAGIYYDTLTTVNGCDSVIATTLTVNPGYNIPDAPVVICNGDSTLLYGIYRKTTGGYYDSLLTVNGCDSIHSAVLTVNPVFNTPASAAICTGDSILLQGSYQTTAGTYYDTLTTLNGCDSVITTILSVNPAITLSMNSAGASCGSSDGSALVSAAGGTPPFSYLWNDPLSQTNDTAFGLSAGSYTVAATDASGCSVSGSVTVNNVGAPAIAVDSVLNATCTGDSDGAIYIAASGTSPLTYDWSTGDTTEDIEGVPTGSYTVTVTDSTGCMSTATATVGELPALVVTNTITNISCNGLCDGALTADVSGGTPPYTYAWSNSATTSGITNLCFGLKMVTVTDINGCTKTSAAFVNQPPVLNLTVSATDNTCNNACNGSATASSTGGIAPYTFDWSNSVTGAIDTGLCAASYDVTVTDGNGCTKTNSVTIAEPAMLAATVSSADATCNGSCDGTASTTPSGGTPPYTYAWSNSATDSSVTGLCAGNYTVTVDDANGCLSSLSVNMVTVNEPAALSIVVDSVMNVSCTGGDDGGIYTTTTGGTGAYTFLWSCGCPPEDLLNRTAGPYSVTVTDVNGCTATTFATVTEPTPVTLSFGSTDASCGNSDGTAWVLAGGGTAPFGFYGYLWSDTAAQTTDTAVAVPAGMYSVTVTDANSCTSFGSVVVSNPGAPNITVDSTDMVSCNGGNDGAAYITATGSGSLTYYWSNGDSADDASSMVAGMYSVSVTDGNGCVGFTSVSVAEPVAISISLSSVGASCNGVCDGSSAATVSGGTPPYAYGWNSGETGSDAISLCAGNNNVTVTDGNGCTATQTVTVTEPAAIVINFTSTGTTCNGVCDGAATASVTGGAPPYTYVWSNSQTGSDVTGLCAGNIGITVTDASGCSKSSSVLISEPAALNILNASGDVQCNGACDGYAIISVSGGNLPYTYLWSNNATDTLIFGLCPGVYVVTVTDGNGCADSISRTITEPAALIVAATATDASCNAACDGTANVTVNGGTPPYMYLWDDPGASTVSPVSVLCAGTFNVTVTDANGCTSTSSATVGEPPALTLSLDSISATIAGGCFNGQAVATAGGGTGPYTYVWNDFFAQTNSTATGLFVGTYSVTVSDANGCAITDSIVIECIVGTEITMNNETQFNSYPNPAKEVLEIVCNTPFGDRVEMKIKFFNAGGKMVKEFVMVNKKISITGLAEGMYAVKLEVNGEMAGVQRVVIIR